MLFALIDALCKNIHSKVQLVRMGRRGGRGVTIVLPLCNNLNIIHKTKRSTACIHTRACTWGGERGVLVGVMG